LESKIYIESRGNAKVVDGNQVGALQINPVMIRECNNILKRAGEDKSYDLTDRFDLIKSKEIYRIVMEHHNPDFDLFTASSIWNAGKKPWRLEGDVYGKVLSYHNIIIKRMKVMHENILNNQLS
jgi:hypothetical protein